jgi:filamentous hemagglutinin
MGVYDPEYSDTGFFPSPGRWSNDVEAALIVYGVGKTITELAAKVPSWYTAVKNWFASADELTPLVDTKVIADLQASGVKISPQNVVATGKNAAGQTVWLETGDLKSGLTHIVNDHGAEFAKFGITEAEIPSTVIKAVTEGKFIGYQGSDMTRPIYEVVVNGKVQRIAVTVGDNGYIVGANPTSGIGR